MKNAVLLLAASVYLFSACDSSSSETSTPVDELQRVHTQTGPSITLKDPAGATGADSLSSLELGIVAIHGAAIKEAPDSNSKTLSLLDYRTTVQIERAIGNDWYAIKTQIPTKVYDENSHLITKNLPGIGYVLKRQTAKLGEIPLIENELNLISYLQEKNDTLLKPAVDPALSEKYHLRFQLITSSEFLAKQKESIRYLKEDTLNVRKNKRVITLKCERGPKQYVDKGEEVDSEFYTYLGQFENIQHYLLYGQFWEDDGYYLVDQTNGKETAFYARPHVSPDTKYIVAVEQNYGGSDGSSFELYQFKDHTPQRLFAAWFYRWLCYEDEAFFAKDGCFYVPVVNDYFNTDDAEAVQTRRQYLKITLP